MIRRAFLLSVAAAALLPFQAFAQRRRKRKSRWKTIMLPERPKGGFANEVERRQVLQSFPSDRIRVALDVVFLMRAWTVEELDAELQRREVQK